MLVNFAEELSETESLDDSEFSLDSESTSSFLSDGTLTNTTVCSLATVDYRNEIKKVAGDRKKGIKVKVVTKANRSTITDKANVCDVSTVTYDWWSPIVEKKDCKKDVLLEKKNADIVMNKENGKRSMKTKEIMTDGRIVTFKSRAQIIPSSKKLYNLFITFKLSPYFFKYFFADSSFTIADILSPSRYLLEVS